MQGKQQVQQQFWKPILNNVELVFEEAVVQQGSCNQIQGKTGEIQNYKNHKDEDPDQDEAYLLSEGPSRQIIQLQAKQNTTDKISVSIQLQNFIIDQANGVYLTNYRNYIPQINVNLSPDFMAKILEEQKDKQSSIIIELMLCQKSHSHQRQKFKVIKGGISGCARKKIMQKTKIEFKGLKFNYNSNPDKNSKLLIALYKINKQRARHYFQILSSKDIFIIEDRNSILIQDYKALNQYFQLFGVDFMERPTSTVKINKTDKYAYHQQISVFQKYLIKKNKKILHIIHLAFKFPHFVEIYFRKPENVKQDEEIDLNDAFGNALRTVTKQINQQVYRDTSPKLVCNHFDPQTKIILNININMRKVRFFMRKQFTKLISFIASQQPQNYENYVKFPTSKQLKQFYVEYYAYASKQKNINQPLSRSNQSPPQIINANSLPLHYTSEKKLLKKPNDDDFNEKQLQEELESELQNQSSQNYSLSENKKARRLAAHKRQEQKKNYVTGINSKQAKYPTRIKTRQMQYNQESDSKKALLNKKIKEKQLAQQQLQQQQLKKPMLPGQMPMGMPMGMSMGMPMGMPMGMNMPFQIINPNSSQNPSMGMFPMMAAMQQGQTANQQGQPKKDGNAQSTNSIQGQTQGKFSIAGQQMGIGMPGVYPGMPGVIGVMGGMPGMGQGGQGTQGQGQGQGGQIGQPMMINPAMMNPSMMGQMMMMNPSMMNQAMMNQAMMNPAMMNQAMMNQAMMKKNQTSNGTSTNSKQNKQQGQTQQQSKMPIGFPMGMGMGINPAMMQMVPGMMPGMMPQGMTSAGSTAQGQGQTQPMIIQGPNGMFMVYGNPNAQSGQNSQTQGQNQNSTSTNNPNSTSQSMPNMSQAMMMNPAMMGMMNPSMMGMNPAMMGMMGGINPNQGQMQNPNAQGNTTNPSSQMNQNPYMMAMHPQMGMSMAQMAQMMGQNKMEPKKQQNNNVNSTSLNSKPTTNMNPNQKNSPVTNKTSKPQLGKKQDKPEGSFPPNMQQNFGMMNGMPMYNPMMNQGQMMMASNKQAKDHQDKMMGMSPNLMMGVNPQNMTPQMMHQLQQMGASGGNPMMNQMMQNQMMQSMGMNPMINPMMNSMMQQNSNVSQQQQSNVSTANSNTTQGSNLNGMNVGQTGQNGSQGGMSQMMNNPQYQQFMRNQMMQQMMMQQQKNGGWSGMMNQKKDQQEKK